MRLFVAVPVASQLRDALDRVLGPVRDAHPRLRWTSVDAWHLTLAFVGEVPELGPVVDAVVPAGRGHAPAGLTLGAAGSFGDRVLWAAVHDRPDGALAAIARDVVAGLADAGVEVADRPLAPHLTLARAGRGRVGPREVAAVDTALGGLDPALLAWDVEALEVWRSHLGRGPARYEVVARVPLSGPG